MNLSNEVIPTSDLNTKTKFFHCFEENTREDTQEEPPLSSSRQLITPIQGQTTFVRLQKTGADIPPLQRQNSASSVLKRSGLKKRDGEKKRSVKFEFRNGGNDGLNGEKETKRRSTVKRLSKFFLDGGRSPDRKHSQKSGGRASIRQSIRQSIRKGVRTQSRIKSTVRKNRDVSFESGSDKDESVLLAVQDLYITKQSPDRRLTLRMENEILQTEKLIRRSTPLQSQTESLRQIFYKLARRKLARRYDELEVRDPEEFNMQIQMSRDHKHVPNDEKLKDLRVIEKPVSEKIKEYTDRYPLLTARKFFLKLFSYISLVCNETVHNSIFDYFILLVIIGNSIILAMDDPTTAGPDSILFSRLDNVFLGIYTVEMILKIFGMGFVLNRQAYLRDAWNVMDFVIVITAYVPIVFASDSVNLQAFRSLRVLRPLRTISNIQALRVLIVTLIAAMKPLLDTLFVLFFLLSIFAIAGLQLFSGLMKKRCFSLEQGIPMTDPNEPSSAFQKFCVDDSSCRTVNDQVYICGKMIANPIYGIANFDTIFSALLMVFQSVTLEGWSMLALIMKKTFSPFAIIYFIVLIFVGAFFLLNLTLAVIKAEFTSNSRETAHIKTQKRLTNNEKFIKKMHEHKLDIIALLKKKRQGILMYNKYTLKKNQVIAIEKSRIKGTKTESGAKRKRRDRVSNSTRNPTSFMNGIMETFGRAKRPDFLTVVRLAAESKERAERNKLKIATSPYNQNRVYTHEDNLPLNQKSTTNSALTSPKQLSLQNPTSESRNSFLARFELTSPTEKFALLTAGNGETNRTVQSDDIKFDPLMLKRESSDISNHLAQTESQKQEGKDTAQVTPLETEPDEVSPFVDENVLTTTNSTSPVKNKYFQIIESPIKIVPISRDHFGKRGREITCIEEAEESDEVERGASRGVTTEPSKLIPGYVTKNPLQTIEEIPSFNMSKDRSLSRPNFNPDFKMMSIAHIIGKSPRQLTIDSLHKGDFEKSAVGVSSRQLQAESSLINHKDEEERPPVKKLVRINTLQADLQIFDLAQSKNLDVDETPLDKVPSTTNSLKKKMNQIRSLKALDEESDRQKQKKEPFSQFNLTEYSQSDFENNQSSVLPTVLLDDSAFLKARKGVGKSSAMKKQKTLAKKGISKKFTRMASNRSAKSAKSAYSRQNSVAGGANSKLRRITKKIEKQALDVLFDVRIENKKDEKVVIDVRNLKLEIVKNREYEETSLDDVLPSKNEREKILAHEREKKFLSEHKFPMNYRVTGQDKENARQLLIEYYNPQKELNSRLAFLKHPEAVDWKNAKKEAENIEQDIKELINQQRRSYVLGSRVSQSGMPSSNFTNKSKRRRLNILSTKESEEDYLPLHMMNNYFEVLNRMIRPFDNEVEPGNFQHQGIKYEPFDLPESHRDIRKNDILSEKIDKQNWSGDTVLMVSRKTFPMMQTKKALNDNVIDIWLPGIQGFYYRCQKKVKEIVESSTFNNIILICVVVNTAMLASDGFNLSHGVTNTFNDLNIAFTVIFAIEMLMKIFGYGTENYAKDRMNLFDALIVILSLVDWIFSANGKSKKLSAFRAIRLLRTFRVLRVTKLLRSLAYMKIIIGVIVRSLKKFIYIALLLLLLIFIYSLLGMQLFGGKFNYADNKGDNRLREDFDSFVDAFVTVFQVMTQENWPDLLILSLRSTVNQAVSLIYLVSWIFIGNYIFLNLFVAILLDEFTGEEVEEDLKEIEEYEGEEGEQFQTKSTSPHITTIGTSVSKGATTRESLKPKGSTVSRPSGLFGEFMEDEKGKAFLIFDNIPCERALWVFTTENRFRRLCCHIVKHKHFESVILVMILFSSIKLAVDTYIPSDNVRLNEISNDVDYFINGVFIMEAILKVVTYGFLWDEKSYIRESWNILDLIIVISSILDMSIVGTDLSFIRILRLLRTLRPLRFISHNENMRVVVTALMESVGAILNVVIVVLIIWLMFAILAVSIVGGKLGYCTNLPNGVSKYGIGITKCAQMGCQWQTPDVNFDNVLNAMLSLFIVSTQENWPNIMYTVIDANDASIGPTEGNMAAFGYIYFMTFLLIGSYFLLNLFIGVIFLKFLQAQKRENKIKHFLTCDQEKWVIIQRLITLAKPNTSDVEPKVKWMKPFFAITRSSYFDVFIMSCIVLNIVTMALSYDGSSNSYNNVLNIINICFSSIFCAEMVLKHLALGPRRYWKSNWNKFDAFVVFASIIDIVLNLLTQTSLKFLRAGPQIARIMRVLRVSRLFKLVKSLEGLQKILNTLIFSLPSLANVGVLLILVYFIFAVLATFLFSGITLGNDINANVNFKNFFNSIIVLFRTSTGEDWYVIMFDTMYPQQCYGNASKCTTTIVALIFWITFIVICEFIFLNLFILIILQQFEEYHLNPDNPINRFREELENSFVPVWKKYSAKYEGVEVAENQLLPLFQSMPPPLGFKDTSYTKKKVAKEITQMNFVTDSYGMLFYNDVLFGAFKNAYGNENLIGHSHYVLKEELKSRHKLDHIRKKEVSTWRGFSKDFMASLRKPKNSVNPIFKLLFLGMTMKTWVNYSKKINEKIIAAKENDHEYISSASEEEDYTDLDSNDQYPDSSDDSSNQSEDDDEDFSDVDDNDEDEEDEECYDEEDEDECIDDDDRDGDLSGFNNSNRFLNSRIILEKGSMPNIEPEEDKESEGEIDRVSEVEYESTPKSIDNMKILRRFLDQRRFDSTNQPPPLLAVIQTDPDEENVETTMVGQNGIRLEASQHEDRSEDKVNILQLNDANIFKGLN